MVKAGIFGVGIPILLFVLCVAALLLGLGKLFSNPEARKIGKIFLVLPLLVVGSLLLAFVVLTVVYWFAGIESHGRFGIHVSDTAHGTDVKISAGGPEIHVSDTAQGTEVNISANAVSVDKPGPASPPPQPLYVAESKHPSGAAKVLLAVNKAFVSAIRSMVAKTPPVAAGPPEASKAIASAVRPVSASGPSGPGAVAVASVSGIKPAAAASIPTSKAAAAAPEKASKRPTWIDNPPQPSADAYEVAVKAGPFSTPVECEQELDEKIVWTVDSYVAWRIGEEASEEVSLPADYARTHLVKDQWLEKINTAVGEMYNLHALLSFDRQVEGRLRDTWTGIVTAARLVLAAAVLGGVLLLLSVIYGYLKIDLATGGAYRGRLRLAVAAILVLAVAATALVSHTARGIYQPPPEVNAKNV